MGMSIYQHDQTSASDTWTITHNLGVKPIFDVTTYVGGVLVKTMPLSCTHLSDNALEVKFSSAKTGKVRLAGGSTYRLNNTSPPPPEVPPL